MRFFWKSAPAMATVLTLCAAPGFASPKYVSPKVRMDLVAPPPALADFIVKLRGLASGPADDAELESLFADDTEKLYGGIEGSEGGSPALKSDGIFDRKAIKLFEAARSVMMDERPPGWKIEDHANEEVQKFLPDVKGGPRAYARRPGKPRQICSPPIPIVTSVELARAVAATKETNATFMATLGAVPVYAKNSTKSQIIATLPAKSAVAMERTYDGGMFNALTPAGQKGFADQTRMAKIYSVGLCFGPQKGGSWLISAVFVRNN